MEKPETDTGQMEAVLWEKKRPTLHPVPEGYRIHELIYCSEARLPSVQLVTLSGRILGEKKGEEGSAMRKNTILARGFSEKCLQSLVNMVK